MRMTIDLIRKSSQSCVTMLLCLSLLGVCTSLGAEVYHVNNDAVSGGDGLSWATAFTSIQDAIDTASAAGDSEVWVASGTYIGVGDEAYVNDEAVGECVVVLASDVSIYGGFDGTENQREERDWRLNETIISGENIRRCVGGADNSGIDGFILTNGSASGTVSYMGRGGGIFCFGDSPVISNCQIINNAAQRGGGIYNHFASPEISNCIIASNSANTIGAGIDNLSYSSPVITNCLLYDNESVDKGGAILCNNQSSPALMNCTISDNTAGVSGGAIYCSESSSPSFTNCIVWSNGDGVHVEDSNSHLLFTYSCVQGGAPGVGNIDDNPLFIDADGGDYMLPETSPCVEVGTSENAPAIDLAGNSRLIGKKVDIGAYECTSVFSPEPSDVYYVDDDASPGGDGTSWATAYSSIQDGIDSVEFYGSGEVWVAAGIYIGVGGNAYVEDEAVGECVIVFKPDVMVFGGFDGTESERDERDWRTNETVIDGGNIRRCVGGADNSVLDGMTLTNGLAGGVADYTGRGGGVFCFGDDLVLSNCKIINNTAERGGGIYSHFSSPEITNCIIANNTATRIGGGIDSLSYSSPVLTNCLFYGNESTDQGGAILCNNQSSPTFMNCTICDNSAGISGGAVYCSESSFPTFTNCILWSNAEWLHTDQTSRSDFDYCCVQEVVSGDENINEDPVFTDAESGDYTLINTSPCVEKGTSEGAPAMDLAGNDRPYSRYVDIGAYECTTVVIPEPSEIYFVDDDAAPDGDGRSWATAFNTIKQAIDEAVYYGGSEVWVAEGTYTVDGRGHVVEMEQGISVYGGFAGSETSRDQRDWEQYSTILDGEGNNRGARGADDATLDGFTITRGFSHNASGAGMYIRDCSPVIKNCVFLRNAHTYQLNSIGGGIYASGSSAVISNCRFIENSVLGQDGYGNGGGIYSSNCTLRVENCYFEANVAACESTGTGSEGGAIYLAGDEPSGVTGCVFKENLASNGNGGAVHVGYSDSRIENCHFIANSASAFGGAISCRNGSNPDISNCVFVENFTEGGSGCAISSRETSMANLVNCTLWGNAVDEDDICVYGFFSGLVTMKNCILWDNGIAIDHDSTVTDIDCTYSCISGGYSGEGNIDSDPRFVNSGEGDLRLLPDSLCIDSGSSDGIPETDIRGYPRQIGLGVDMGAYESVSEAENMEVVFVLLGYYDANDADDLTDDGVIDAADLIGD